MKKILLLLTTIVSTSVLQAQTYCTSNATTTADEEIGMVQIIGTTLANLTDCTNPLVGSQGIGTGTANTYTNFTAAFTPTPLFAGQNYTIKVRIFSCGTFNFNSAVKVYMDFNHDGDFIDIGEEVYYSGVGAANQITCVPPDTAVGSIFIPITASGLTRMRVVDKETGQISATSITPCGTYGFGETEDYLLDIIPPPPCSGVPTCGNVQISGVVAPDTTSVCPTTAVNACVFGSSVNSQIAYQWQKSTGNGIWTNTSAADTGLCFTVAAGLPSAWYRFTSLCLNSFDGCTSDSFYIKNSLPTYATVPYTQGFETWGNYCSNNDVPNDNHWINTPDVGESAWRRNDQGNTAAWNFPGNGQFLPTHSEGLYSARFHAYDADSIGNLDLYIDLGSAAGAKELQFDYKDNSNFGNMDVELSTNAGVTFTNILSVSGLNNWTTQVVPITSNAPNAILRFVGNPNGFTTDQAIDNLKIIGPCSGQPTAGIIPDTNVCSGDSFALKLTGVSLAAGLSYQWQSNTVATGGTWSTVNVTSINNCMVSVTGPTYFRCIVTCLSSGLSATSAVMSVGINPFYYCYCKTGVTSTFDYYDIGCVQLINNAGVTLINNIPLSPIDTFSNPNATNSYTAYQNIITPPVKIYRDSLYTFNMTAITTSSFQIGDVFKVYIDFDRNGQFDPSDAAGFAFMNSSNVAIMQTTIPNNTALGITGMRVIAASSQTVLPCVPIPYGEIEDYLVDLSVPPCAAPTNAGVAHTTETLLCPGYATILFDTNHVKLTAFQNLSMNWQQSTNNGTTWTSIAGGTTDSIQVIVNQKTLYRLQVRCAGGDTTYSNIVTVNMEPSNACYPASGSLGGSKDTADNGYFTIGNYSFSSGGATGPHLGNPSAIRTRTNFSSLGPIELYNDSTYTASFYNILKPYNHADARITMFIDYNGNGIYDIPAERIFTGTSGPTTFYLPHTFKTSINPLMEVPVGMRIVLNNNTFTNTQSDLGVGLYTSGETEDFLVKFKQHPSAINNVFSAQNVVMYPNPTNGVLTIDAIVNSIENLKVSVTTITGVVVQTQGFKNLNGKWSTTLDLTGYAKGNYIVKFQTEKGSFVQKVTVE